MPLHATWQKVGKPCPQKNLLEQKTKHLLQNCNKFGAAAPDDVKNFACAYRQTDVLHRIDKVAHPLEALMYRL